MSVTEERSSLPCETSELIINLDKKLFRFDGLDKEPFDLKYVIIKGLKIENQQSRWKVNDLESRVVSVESKTNFLEHYERRNNLEISDIPVTDENKKPEENVIQILNEIDINVTSNGIKTHHRIGKTKNHFKKKLVRLGNQRFAKKALLSKKNLNIMNIIVCNSNVVVE